mgnify:CR=1 FL=1
MVTCGYWNGKVIRLAHSLITLTFSGICILQHVWSTNVNTLIDYNNQTLKNISRGLANLGFIFSECLMHSSKTSSTEFPTISGIHQPLPSSPEITALPVFLFIQSQTLSPIFSQIYGLSLRGFSSSSKSISSILISIATSDIGFPLKYKPLPSAGKRIK